MQHTGQKYSNYKSMSWVLKECLLNKITPSPLVFHAKGLARSHVFYKLLPWLKLRILVCVLTFYLSSKFCQSMLVWFCGRIVCVCLLHCNWPMSISFSNALAQIQLAYPDVWNQLQCVLIFFPCLTQRVILATIITQTIWNESNCYSRVLDIYLQWLWS